MKTIVFDLDGTLVNTIYDIGNSMNQSLAEHGFPTHPLDSYYNFIGEGVIILTKKAIGNMDIDDETLYSVLNRYNEIYHDNSTVLSRPYDNIEFVLDNLIEKGYQLAVISNKPDPDTNKVVKHYFKDRFKYICGWKKEVNRKPDRMAMDIMIEALDLDINDITYVGDSRYDAMFAINSGCKYFLFEYGYEKKDILHSFTPVAFLNEAMDLLKYF